MEVPISSPPLKISIKLNWEGKDRNITCLLLVNATNNISSFLALDLMEDQVASINEDDEALTQA